MAQQMATYERGLKLMVSAAFRVQTKGVTSVRRIQVGVFFSSHDWCLIRPFNR